MEIWRLATCGHGLQSSIVITKDPTQVMDAATLPRKTFMSENKRRSETATVNNDKPQGSVAAHEEYGGTSNY